MSDKSVENRLATLEEQVRHILGVVSTPKPEQHTVKDWRKSLGMFNGRSTMMQIDMEGQRIRQQDREQVANDHP